MVRLIQPSFARGEIGSDLYGRVDVSAYAVALRTAINCIVHAYGGISNRSGLKFIAPCKTHTGAAPRLIEFKYNTEDTYILEFGEQYMRVIRNDAQVLNPDVVVTGVTQANPGVVTAASHGFSNGDDVYIAEVVGMAELNGRWFRVANVTANTFELTDQRTGTNVDTTGYTAYSSGGTVASVYEITTPFALADVMRIAHVQSANVMTLVHTSYPPQELSRSGHTSWTLSEITFAPEQDHPTGLSATSLSGTGTNYTYFVTAINEETQEESLTALHTTTRTITGATQANPVVVTSAGHGYANGDEIEINSVAGMTELNGRRFELAGVTANTFQLVGEDGTGHTAYSSGGTANHTFCVVSSGATPNNRVSWTAVTGAVRYSVYRDDNGLSTWIGDTEDTSFDDVNIEGDASITPPRARNPFFGTNTYPGAVSYYEQRRVFGRTNNRPDTSFYSVTGSQRNMSSSSPRQADDAITATLNSLSVNEIRSFVPMNDLLIFTSGAEWRVNSGTDSAFSAETLKQKPQSNWGTSYLEPIVVGDRVLFVTENSSYVRSIGYEITIDGYKGNDMTVFAPHLFRNATAVDWAFTQWPDPLIAIVRSDGWIAALTFNPEQEVVAWTRWRTFGKFLRVASTLPNEDAVDYAPYFVVRRKIGGTFAYYIERSASRRFSDVRDCFFVDSGLSYDAPVAITGVALADPVVITAASHGFTDGDEVDLSDILWDPVTDSFYNETQPDQLNDRRYFVADAATNTFSLVKKSGRKNIIGATQANPVVITSTDHGLSNGDVIGIFNVAGMTQLNGNTYEAANVTANTFELNTVGGSGVDGTGFSAYSSGGTAYPAEDGSAFIAYDEGGYARKAVQTVSGLWHLEGQTVVVLADGNVISDLTVASGSVTLSRKASRIHIGLRYVSDIETLNPEIASGGQTIQGRKVRVPSFTVRLKDSRGLLAGPNCNDLQSMKQREFEAYGEPTALLTGDKTMEIESDWFGGGRICLRQIHPLPLTVTALIPELDLGDDED